MHFQVVVMGRTASPRRLPKLLSPWTAAPAVSGGHAETMRLMRENTQTRSKSGWKIWWETSIHRLLHVQACLHHTQNHSRGFDIRAKNSESSSEAADSAPSSTSSQLTTVMESNFIYIRLSCTHAHVHACTHARCDANIIHPCLSGPAHLSWISPAPFLGTFS